MTPQRSLLTLMLAGAAFSAICTHAQVSASSTPKLVPAPDSCPVTKPGDQPFVPPYGYPKKLSKDSFWYGTDRLWISLPANGAWRLGHYAPKDPSFRQKIMWWRQGLQPRTDLRASFKIDGRRLDSDAPPLRSDPPLGVSGSNPVFIMSGINFPTSGCWEVTGRYDQDALTFVIWIVP